MDDDAHTLDPLHGIDDAFSRLHHFVQVNANCESEQVGTVIGRLAASVGMNPQSSALFMARLEEFFGDQNLARDGSVLFGAVLGLMIADHRPAVEFDPGQLLL
jgi:hypothetical protein